MQTALPTPRTSLKGVQVLSTTAARRLKVVGYPSSSEVSMPGCADCMPGDGDGPLQRHGPACDPAFVLALMCHSMRMPIQTAGASHLTYVCRSELAWQSGMNRGRNSRTGLACDAMARCAYWPL